MATAKEEYPVLAQMLDAWNKAPRVISRKQANDIIKNAISILDSATDAIRSKTGGSVPSDFRKTKEQLERLISDSQPPDEKPYPRRTELRTWSIEAAIKIGQAKDVPSNIDSLVKSIKESVSEVGSAVALAAIPIGTILLIIGFGVYILYFRRS